MIKTSSWNKLEITKLYIESFLPLRLIVVQKIQVLFRGLNSFGRFSTEFMKG